MAAMMLDLETMTDRAYRLLREAILNGQLAGGERLSQHRMARQLGMTVNPFREALTRLERDGLVEIQPQWGARVRMWRAEDIIAQYDLRIALECEMGRRCARLAGEDLRGMAELAWEVDVGHDHLPREYEMLGKLDYQLHEKIAQASRSETLLKAWEREVVLGQMARAAVLQGPTLSMQPKMHCILIAKIASGDPNLASEGAREHLEYSCAVEISRMNLTDKYPKVSLANWYKGIDVARFRSPSDILEYAHDPHHRNNL